MNSEEWLLKFNIDKFLVMHYGLKNRKYPLYINGKQLVEFDFERDLGIEMESFKQKNQVIIQFGRIQKSFALFDCI